MALSARGWRFVYGGLAVVTAISFAPLLSVVIASATGSALGCRLDEGDAHPCPLAGHDIGDLLYAMFVMGWLMLVTWPGMVFTVLAWLALSVRAVARRVRRVEAR